MRNQYLYSILLGWLLLVGTNAWAAGPHHHLVICPSSELWAWGDNSFGQLGQDPNSLPNQPTPQPLPGLVNIVATAVSEESSYALSGDGHLWCWGGNSRGELGIGNSSGPMWNPTQISLDRIVYIAAGDHHAIAVRDDGTVWAWGANDQGQLGDGSTNDAPQPIQVWDVTTSQQLTGIQSVFSAADHTLALSSNGNIYSWGSNRSGELGTRSGAAFSQWPAIVPFSQKIANVGVGALHCLVEDYFANVYAWGDNSLGQVGDGSRANQNAPVLIPFPNVTVSQLACTRFTSLATTSPTIGLLQLYAWGDNSDGEFGQCDPPNMDTPFLLSNFIKSPATLIGEGTVVRMTDITGTLYTWGGGPDYVGYQPPAPTASGGSCVITALSTCNPISQPLPCARNYQQQPDATYLATNHLGPNAAASDIGAYGQSITIDASLSYNGQVRFDGQYHVRGTVYLQNGTFELLPGTVFYVDGLSGQSDMNAPTSALGGGVSPYATYIHLENATLIMHGATMQAACNYAWGGIEVGLDGIIRTDKDPASGQRSLISDAIVAVNSTGGVTNNNNPNPTLDKSQYYLKNTDFVNNLVGINDNFKGIARAGEGVHYCTFSSVTASLLPPFNNPPSAGAAYVPFFGGIGIILGLYDAPYNSDYAAETIDHSQFNHLEIGISGVAVNLHIQDNTFDNVCNTAIDTETYQNLQPMYVERNTITVRSANDYGIAYTTGIAGSVFTADNIITGDNPDPAQNSVLQVGIDTDLIGSSVTGNSLTQLDWGINAGLSDFWQYLSGTLSGNLLHNCYQGIRFNGTLATGYHLDVRCNTFQNPAALPGVVGLNILPNTLFPSDLGSAPNPNGNRFGTNGVLEPHFTPIVVGAGTNNFTYHSYRLSSQEIFPLIPPARFSITQESGDPAYACVDFSNGIQARSALIAPVKPTDLRAVQDSLRQVELPTRRQSVLVSQLIGYTQQNLDFMGLEQFIGSLPDPAAPSHATLTNWLMQAYRQRGQAEDADRLQAQLLRYHASNAEIRNHALLWTLEGKLSRQSQLSHKIAATDLSSLRAIAQSATAAAWPACRLLRHYEPQCRCRLASNETVAQSAAAPKAKPKMSLGTLSLYPNPASEQVAVSYILPSTATTAQLALHDPLGRLVYQTTLPTDRPSGELTCPVSQLAPGLYVLTLVVNGQTVAAQRAAIQR